MAYSIHPELMLEKHQDSAGEVGAVNLNQIVI